MALNIEEIQGLLASLEVDKQTKIDILKAAEELEKEKKEEREEGKAPKAKNQFVVVIKGISEEQAQDVVAHIFTIPEADDAGLLLDKLRTASAEQNAGAKRKKSRVETFDDVTGIKRKYLKPEGILLKTKQDWVRTIALPKDYKFVEIPQETI